MKNYSVKFKIIFIVIIFLGLFGLAKSSLASSPVLNFSDLTSGPATGLGDGKGSGVIVTVWGNNLGTPTITNGQPQSGYSVTVNGTPASYIYEWTNATQHAGHPADLYTYHKMQDIMFSVPNIANGSYSIKVTVNGVDTINTLPFTVRSGNIVHVKSTGTDSAGCGNWNSPCLTLQYAMDNATTTGGDAIYVNAGVNPSTSLIIGQWTTFTGTISTPTTVTAYPGVSVTVNGSLTHFAHIGPYWTVSKLKFVTDGGVTNFGQGYHFVANEAAGTGACIPNYETGVMGDGGDSTFPPQFSSDVHLLGNYVHGFGCATTTQTKMFHTFYISNRTGVQAAYGDEVGWNVVVGNYTNYGIHTYDEGTCGGWGTAMLYHDNVVKDQRGSGMDWNMSCSSGTVTTPVYMYNNLFINTGLGFNYHDSSMPTGGCAICLSGAGTGTYTGAMHVWNNTIYGFADAAVAPSPYGAIQLSTWQSAASWGSALDLRNNIIVDTHGYPYFYGTDIAVSPSTNNIWYSTQGASTPPSWDTAWNGRSSNPLFTNTGNNDFSLQNASPALGAGYNLTSTISTDILGNIRPVPQSIGTFDASSGGSSDTTPPAAPGELSVY